MAAAPGKTIGLPSAIGHSGTRHPHWASPSAGPSCYVALASGPLSQAGAVLDDRASSTPLNGNLLFQGCRQEGWGRGLGCWQHLHGHHQSRSSFPSSTWGSLGTGRWRRQVGDRAGPGTWGPSAAEDREPHGRPAACRVGRQGPTGLSCLPPGPSLCPGNLGTWEPGGQPPSGGLLGAACLCLHSLPGDKKSSPPPAATAKSQFSLRRRQALRGKSGPAVRKTPSKGLTQVSRHRLCCQPPSRVPLPTKEGKRMAGVAPGP